LAEKKIISIIKLNDKLQGRTMYCKGADIKAKCDEVCVMAEDMPLRQQADFISLFTKEKIRKAIKRTTKDKGCYKNTDKIYQGYYKYL
jgi:hypothetical protein